MPEVVVVPSTASPQRAESRSAGEEYDEDEFTDDLDLNDLMSIFGGEPQDYSHVKRSSNEYYIDMDQAASSPVREQQYQWKTVSPKTSAPNKRSANHGQEKSGNGKVYTLHIVTDSEHDNGGFNAQPRSNNNYQRSSNSNNHNNNNGGGAIRVRNPRSKIHVIPIKMRSNGKSSSNGKARIVKRFRSNTRPDERIRYDSHSHSEEVQDIVVPAGSDLVDTKYEQHQYDNKYEVVHPKDLSTNELKQDESADLPESQYMDHDPFEPEQKVKVRHTHHHHHHNHVKTVIKKVPQPYPVEKIVHVPVEKIVHVPKPYPVDKIVDRLVHVPVERVIHVPRPVDRVVEKIVHVPKPYPVDRIVEKPVPVNRPVRVNVPYPVEKIVHVPKPYPVEKIVEKIVHVPKPYPVIKHVNVPFPVEKKVPYPVKVEVEKKVPYPVKVYVPKPYPVERKVPETESPPKKNSYRTNFEKNRMAGAQSYQNINHGQYHQATNGGQREQQQQQQQHQFSSQGGQVASTQEQEPQYEYNYVPQMTAMDYGFAQAQQSSQQQQQQSSYPYQFESSQEMQQYMMAGQPTGSETEQQDYVFNTSEQAQQQQQQTNLGPSGTGASAPDSVDAASSDSLVNSFAPPADAEAAPSNNAAAVFQINVPDHAGATAPTTNLASRTEPQFGESKTVSHLLQITPFMADPKAMAYTRPVDQFVVFHTGTGFTMPK